MKKLKTVILSLAIAALPLPGMAQAVQQPSPAPSPLLIWRKHNPDNTLQVMYQRVGDEFLCIVKKYGSKTNPDEAITVSPEEYVKGFKKCVKEHWFFNFFKDNKIITWR